MWGWGIYGEPHSGGYGAELWGCPIAVLVGLRCEAGESMGRPIAVDVGLKCGVEMWGCPIAEVVGLRWGAAP